jgi:membrane protease YdiL (CAAX protease family)
MLTVGESTLLLIDIGLHCAGVFVFAVVAFRWSRSGAWRNPLEPLALVGGGPGLEHLIGVFAAYVALAFGLGSLLVSTGQIDPAAAQIRGTSDWHVAQCIDAGARLAVCVLIVTVLRRHRSFSVLGDRPLGLVGTVGVGCGAVLVILPVAYLQLQMGQIIWLWLEPGAEQPMHAVLEAIQTTAWGAAGIVQLTITAVVVAPIAEELFFRGLLLQTIWRYSGHAWLAIVLTGVTFGLIHHEQPQDVLPLVTMGVILGYVRVRYRSLPACALVHALFNARTMIFVLLDPESARSGL